ncbi:cell division protein FtsQ/DivIB [Liquorilactobacillus sicerae]|uniref:cell division protein FtsQ/DivIB n=1 Tax=Liquorilactobacillus sicerae TaxID=1416943 RepID=UPI00247FB901|nr:cell division protein FtsQ/DivIB [Liquorilactobacillus sicerae]
MSSKKNKMKVQTDLPLTPWETAQRKRQQQKHPHLSFFKKQRIGDKLPSLVAQRRKRLRKALIENLLVFGMLLLAALYFILPISKVKSIEVSSDNQHTAKQIIKLSGIKPQQLQIGVLLRQNQIQAKIKNQASEIKKVSFSYSTKQVKLKIIEKRNLGYVSKNNLFYRIETNGKISKISHQNPVSDVPIYFNFKKRLLCRQITQQIEALSPKIVRAISEIHAAPTKNDPQRVHLYMNDGNQVLATIKTLAAKMRYYPQFKASSSQKIMIDLQVGAYSYPLQ